MKTILLSCLLALVTISPVIAQRKSSPEAEAFFKKAMSQINPRHVAWVKLTAKTVQEQKMQETEIRKAATGYASPLNLNDASIEALCFLVMMQAARDASEDLKEIMAKIKSINQQKQDQRDLLSKMQRQQLLTTIQLDSFMLLRNKTIALQNHQNPNTVRLIRSGVNGDKLSKADISTKVEEMKKDIDAMSELGEAAQLKMQMYMDRMTKAYSAASNMMKKFSEISGQIIGNMK